MRDIILNYLKSLGLKSYQVSTEYPFSHNETPLYLKNPKRIYVDAPQEEREEFIKVLNGKDIYLDTTTVAILFATDAKQLSSEYKDVTDKLKFSSQIDTGNKYFRQVSVVSTEYEKDLLVTTIELKYSVLTSL